MTDHLNRALSKMPGPIRTLFDHNRWTGGALLIIGTLVASLIGCQPRTESPISHKQVTHQQLEGEVALKEVEIRAARERLAFETDAKINELKSQYKSLDYKIEEINATLGPAYEDLQHKQDAVNKAIGMIGALATDSGSPIAGLVVSALGIYAAGSTMDNQRKNRVIQSRLEPATVLASQAVADPVAVQKAEAEHRV
jgi:hypothetical protein